MGGEFDVGGGGGGRDIGRRLLVWVKERRPESGGGERYRTGTSVAVVEMG
jgi:hypothetical protein